MTPDRAASVFRELLATPKQDLNYFARRLGLPGNPDLGDLEHAKEILQILVVAMDSAPGPNWEKVTTMWGTLVARHGAVQPSALEPRPPEWVRDMPTKPTLGDPAPGTHGYQQQEVQRQRFVPAAPQYTAPPSPAPAPAQPPPPPQRKAKPDSIQESVAKYAAFCAACANSPDRVFATMVEYGIASPAARDELDEMWNERFDDDARLQQQWEQLFHQFRQQFGQR
jgi:hypothetical protein